MGKFKVNSVRSDPYRNFKFRLTWDGRNVAGVSQLGGLKRPGAIVERPEGEGPSTARRSPGRAKS